ncbi:MULTISPECIES: hypothetical protein [Arthrospira]|uniref:hypothetical protein n=1 Tax=Oscillatoriales TaxID=1150 RepID=UPI0001D0EAAA|nr:hypothetical protein [Arthrospira platensis]MBD2669902.1 hypothetical protein [Arthrospira platensis FACHB-439]MBD2710422.1 hypothetical protein [Arthrospira platensis FACHB-835]MDF2211666.1 hypothetical protein [Arthrospira platensis NCB002]MDT9183312.1 hypothetical protein [Limnospira sp. PMC 289.06]MDT9297046.1 hypothetical protein [Arthrospira platensis PCC 7345]MDT9310776.1 hypothetical protein [Limnospira sp. Paracas R14]QQW29689.1 hypothetical protein AP9108_02005 [Arthrospira sp. 
MTEIYSRNPVSGCSLVRWAIALKFPVPHGVPHATTDIVAIPQRQSMDSKKLNEVWR